MNSLSPRSPTDLINQIWNTARELAWISSERGEGLFNWRGKIDSIEAEARKKIEAALGEANATPAIKAKILGETKGKSNHVYRNYSDTPTREELSLTRKEFDEAVEVFKILLKWKQEREEKNK